MSSDLSIFAARLRDFIAICADEPALGAGGSEPALRAHYDAEFNGLALVLVALQFQHNPAYRKFCEARQVQPNALTHWTQIPAVPAAAFKELELTCLPPAARAAVFHSSGTTGQRPSRHFHSAESLAVYEASLLAWFQAQVVPDLKSQISDFKSDGAAAGTAGDLTPDTAHLLLLAPAPAQAPHSSLVHMFETVRSSVFRRNYSVEKQRPPSPQPSPQGEGAVVPARDGVHRLTTVPDAAMGIPRPETSNSASPSPHDEGVGRGAAEPAHQNAPPLPGPLLHSAEEREPIQHALVPGRKARQQVGVISPGGEGQGEGEPQHQLNCCGVRRSGLPPEGGTPNEVFAAEVSREGAWVLNAEQALRLLHRSVDGGQPLVLLGTAFSFVHLLDYLAERNLRFELPPGSRVMETGGYKGRARALPKAELHALITARLGVPPDRIICEYGMSELNSQAYDLGFVPSRITHHASRQYHFPLWARAQVISPETGREVAEGETGLLRVFDLANVFSVMAIQTEDLAVRRGDGFELIGRAEQAEPRGCSLMAI